MNKDIIIVLSIIILGFIVTAIGFAFSILILNLVGIVIIVLPFLFLKLKDFGTRRKSLLEEMENKDKTVLPLPKTNIKLRLQNKKIISAIMSMFVTVIIIAFVYIMLKNYFFELSDIDLEKAVNDGCSKLKMGGNCIIEPSRIVIPYDVNKDGVKGGVGDDLENLLEKYNCTDVCIRKRCGCPT